MPSQLEVGVKPLALGEEPHPLEIQCLNLLLLKGVYLSLQPDKVFGARQEIVDVVRRIIQSGVPPEKVDEDWISQHLYTAGQPDPDIIIRTAGEMRISNFLLWQSAYAEYYAAPVYWPDFDEEALYEALVVYNRRERRYGLLPGEAAS